MNSNTLGELSSDQKIEKVFYAFGYSIPVAKDGRRLWPEKFKQAMGQKMNSGSLSPAHIQKECQVSDTMTYDWKKRAKKNRKKNKKEPIKPNGNAFAQIKVSEDIPMVNEIRDDQLIFRRSGSEIIFPKDYSIDRLAALVRAFEVMP